LPRGRGGVGPVPLPGPLGDRVGVELSGHRGERVRGAVLGLGARGGGCGGGRVCVSWRLVEEMAVVVVYMVRSPWGRLLRGIREDEDAIRSLGKNVFSIKMQALIIGGLFGALGGIVYVLPASVQPDSMGRSLTFFCYTALLLGGAATIFGPVLGAVIFYAARIGIKYTAAAYIPDRIMNNQQTEQFSYIVVGVALMLIVIFRPQGIL